MISSKYYMLYPPLVERILAEESKKKDPEKAAKTRLHQLFGAYVQGNAHKKAAAILKTGPAPEKILALHASTKERLPTLTEFYSFIAAHTGSPESITDLGCGFNPFSIPLMPVEFVKNLKKYNAYDIDMRTRDLLNGFFLTLGLPSSACCTDLAAETPQVEADITFMFKLLPVLDAQIPGRGYELAGELNTRFLVITYPLKSLGGREKGMERNYSEAFESAEAAGKFGIYKKTAHIRIGNELVYILTSGII